MNKEFDIIIIGSGPGGYVAAIRAAQLGMKVAVVEKESLGGVCLNWGCIPTKALLKSAQVWDYIKKADEFGIKISKSEINFTKIIDRSRKIAQDMSKGVDFLMKKNKIEVLKGEGKLLGNGIIAVQNESKVINYRGNNIIIATGARSKELPNIKIDKKDILGYREAMALNNLPKSMVIVGAGAIGCEFAYFYNSLGCKVTLIEYLDRIVPLEDLEVSKQLENSFKKTGIEVMTSTEVLSTQKNKDSIKVAARSKNKEIHLKADKILSAVGIKSNIENLGLENLGIKVEKDKIVIDEYYRTNIKSVFAIGDIVSGPALAHVASAEGIVCVENIAGLNPETIDYNNIPNCTYCLPEVSSVGYTENAAIEAGYKIRVGKFPFTASGKANTSSHKEGFIKLIFDARYGELLGAHMIGSNVTDMIAEIVLARKLETTAHEIIKSVHPHPTFSEAIMEAATNAYDECIHL